jgi:8-oxo-dGTP diphosphatase
MERSVAGVLVHSGKVFIAKRGPDCSFSGCWEFPGGKVEAGESDEAALSREFVEEFGIAVTAKRLLGETVFPHRGKDRALAAWLIELGPGKEPQALEHMELDWATAGELDDREFVDSDRRLLPYVLPLLAP